jgi:hypothetical protein
MFRGKTRRAKNASSGRRSGTDDMLHPALEENLCKARLALDGATSASIIELCKQYLALLAAYRVELYKLPDTVDLNPHSKSSSRESVDERRKEVRAAIEETTRERERAEALILSFTAVSGYGAVETFNRQKYKGRDDWKLGAGGVGTMNGTDGQRMTIQEAVETASLLRREEHVARNAAPASAWPLDSSGSPQPAGRASERNR